MKPTNAIWKKLNRRGEKAKYNRLYKSFRHELDWHIDAALIGVIANRKMAKKISVMAHNLAFLAV